MSGSETEEDEIYTTSRPRKARNYAGIMVVFDLKLSCI